MNEKERNPQSNETRAASASCSRAEDLVAYLYGEASVEEARSFAQHLSACVSCRDELAAFGDVRTRVGDWRREALSDAESAPVLAFDFRPASAQVAAVPSHSEAVLAHHAPQKRSAMAALREFFSLAPVWLQAGTVAAALIVCALAALVFAHTEARWDSGGFAFRLGVGERVVKETVSVPVERDVSQERVNEMLAAREREIKTLRAQLKQQDEQTTPQYVSTNDAATEKKRPRVAPFVRAANRTPRGVVRKQPRLDIADNEENLPRLFDLLSEVN